MSVLKTSTGYAVRWREGSRNRQRSFDRRADAQRWDAEVRRRRQNGTLATLDTGSLTLAAYTADTWTPTYGPLLAPRTRSNYAWAFDSHIAPRLGHLPLHAITPAVLARWQVAELPAGHDRCARRGACSRPCCRRLSRGPHRPRTLSARCARRSADARGDATARARLR